MQKVLVNSQTLTCIDFDFRQCVDKKKYEILPSAVAAAAVYLQVQPNNDGIYLGQTGHNRFVLQEAGRAQEPPIPRWRGVAVGVGNETFFHCQRFRERMIGCKTTPCVMLLAATYCCCCAFRHEMETLSRLAYYTRQYRHCFLFSCFIQERKCRRRDSCRVTYRFSVSCVFAVLQLQLTSGGNRDG